MFDLYFKRFNEKVPVTAAEQAEIQKHLKIKTLRRKQYLLQEGDVCKHIAFVEKGALRLYKLDENGNERIIQFALEGWLISDLGSFITGETSTYNIDAIEDCELVLINKKSQDELLATMPKFETYSRLQLTGAYIAMQRRLSSVISSTPEERYLEFNKLYPNIVQRVPQHMIASYMGLTPETLSRVRKKLLDKK